MYRRGAEKLRAAGPLTFVRSLAAAIDRTLYVRSATILPDRGISGYAMVRVIAALAVWVSSRPWSVTVAAGVP